MCYKYIRREVWLTRLMCYMSGSSSMALCARNAHITVYRHHMELGELSAPLFGVVAHHLVCLMHYLVWIAIMIFIVQARLIRNWPKPYSASIKDHLGQFTPSLGLQFLARALVKGEHCWGISAIVASMRVAQCTYQLKAIFNITQHFVVNVRCIPSRHLGWTCSWADSWCAKFLRISILSSFRELFSTENSTPARTHPALRVLVSLYTYHQLVGNLWNACSHEFYK